MDIILALKFVSQQHLNGVLDGEAYSEALLDVLVGACDQTNTDELLTTLAEFMVKHD